MKSKFLTILSLLTVSTILMTSCGGKKKPEDKPEANTTEAEGKTPNESADGKHGIDFNEEPYEVVLAYIGDDQPDKQKVEEEINKILLEEFNATLKLKSLNWGSFQDDLNLILSGGGNLDLFPVIVQLAPSYVDSEQVIDLTDYIDKYGENIKRELGEQFAYISNIDNYTYGVTTKREWITQMGMMMRKDLLEESGFMVDDINSMQDLEKVYAKVYEAHPDMIMLASAQGDTPLGRWETADMLSDKYGGLMDKGQSTEVVNIFETDEYREYAELMYKWNKAGYLSKDAATTTDASIAQMAAGKAFSYIAPMKAGDVEQDQLQTGKPLTIAPLFGNPYITSFSVNFNTWGLAQTSDNPERAFMVLDYIYGSSEVMNLLNWGIEGEHYVFEDEANGIIKFPEGISEENKSYGLNAGWLLPNQFIAHIWEGNDPDIWKNTQTDIDNALLSKALGFSYNTKSVEEKLAAIRNVDAKYSDAINTGSVDPYTEIDKYNEALYDAGLQDVIDEKQRQLDEWLADK